MDVEIGGYFKVHSQRRHSMYGLQSRESDARLLRGLRLWPLVTRTKISRQAQGKGDQRTHIVRIALTYLDGSSVCSRVLPYLHIAFFRYSHFCAEW